ncbi:hypothetical protein [Amycolatopsis sp. NPDC004378]
MRERTAGRRDHPDGRGVHHHDRGTRIWAAAPSGAGNFADAATGR